MEQQLEETTASKPRHGICRRRNIKDGYYSKDDDLAEGDETFAVTLSASGTDVVPAQMSDGTAIVTITDNDEEEPRNM